MASIKKIILYHIVFIGIAFVASCGSTRKNFEKLQPVMPFDAVIVPGVPFDTAWSDVMRMRVLWSYHLYKEGYTKNVIYSGSAVYSPYIEARIMAEYAKQLGIPEEHIYTDEQAEHSTENVYYGFYLGRSLGFEKIALATDPYQTKMVKSFARRKKLDIHFIPAIFDTVHEYYNDMKVSIDPSPAEVENFIPITEREGFWKRFAGTLGKNLKFKPEEINEKSMTYAD